MPRTPASASSSNPSAERGSSRKRNSIDSGRPTKKIRAEMNLGFDVVASELQKTLGEQVRDISPSKSVQVGQLHLKTTFQSSAKGVSTPQPVSRSGRPTSSSSPVPPRPAGVCSQQSGVSGNLTPITPPSYANPDAAASPLDQVYDETSSQN